ncbi:anti-sigma factor [Rhodococcus rhodnii]|uniref:Regulator of SigK n=2 Tax=Rhodococcus rhodnii TaxID=38312 RepID=R7WNM9_9NOCA|nr:anti-sigma factor [Rhodococcus rhodnii]EOM76912.1 hypothetical protein Rrhod_1825 [Rhodococcus rhodnii LMG 5362]TXG89732.1 anti-sigma factor [Rhodococcus rhodnii]
MTELHDTAPGEPTDLQELAPLYALDAVDDAERREIDTLVARAPREERERFEAIVRDTRETMAAQSAATAQTPPRHVFERVLAGIAAAGSPTPPIESGHSDTESPPPTDLAARRRTRFALAIAAAAAVVVVAIGAVSVVLGSDPDPGPAPAPSVTEQVLAAPDMRMVSVPVEGGTAVVVSSAQHDAGVLMMNDVPPPPDGSAYQLWLLGEGHSPRSAGVMEPGDVGPATTAVVEGIEGSNALAFTVEPPGGSPQPTSDPFAYLRFG